MEPISPDLLAEFNALPCQTEVHLQIPTATKPLRLRSRLIGIEPGMCLILSRGIDQQWEAAKEKIREGQSIVIRLVNQGDPNATIFAYRGNISKLMSSVGRWLVVDYPRRIQKISLRQHSRMPIALASTLLCQHQAQTSFHGVLKDLSLNGGGFVCEPIPLPLSSLPFKLQLNLDNNPSISIDASICNQHLEQRTPERLHYGLTFNAKNAEKKNFVQMALLEMMQRENKTNP
ncbi:MULTISPECIES: PilZ domain-containing protein [unclassified Agarivorans]|uniref:PilZ domain-containing protein n=1 Tax=unclassified Agarivorans TaxID=2636026 RepID=UPI003D7CD2EF